LFLCLRAKRCNEEWERVIKSSFSLFLSQVEGFVVWRELNVIICKKKTASGGRINFMAMDRMKRMKREEKLAIVDIVLV